MQTENVLMWSKSTIMEKTIEQSCHISSEIPIYCSMTACFSVRKCFCFVRSNGWKNSPVWWQSVSVIGGGGVECTERRSQSCYSLGENVTKASAKHRLGEIVAMYHKTPKQGDKHYIHKKHTATQNDLRLSFVSPEERE